MRSNCRGFSLMELSIAMLVFLIGVLTLSQFMIVSVHMHQRSRDLMIALELAQTKADELKRQNFFSPPLSIGGAVPLYDGFNPLLASNPTPIANFVDYLDIKGNCIGTCGTSPTVPPDNAYFVRQWQVWSCSCGTPSCAPPPGCAPTTDQDTLKKITVTVTAMSTGFPATTIMVYKSKVG